MLFGISATDTLVRRDRRSAREHSLAGEPDSGTTRRSGGSDRHGS
jgi:hypothetical protein